MREYPLVTGKRSRVEPFQELEIAAGEYLDKQGKRLQGVRELEGLLSVSNTIPIGEYLGKEQAITHAITLSHIPYKRTVGRANAFYIPDYTELTDKLQGTVSYSFNLQFFYVPPQQQITPPEPNRH